MQYLKLGMQGIGQIAKLKSLLNIVINELDSGHTTLDNDDVEKIIDDIKEVLSNNKPLSKYQAYTYLNISRATFDNMVRDGKIPKGQKIEGFKELFWYKYDLDKIINK
jgi:predicted DNA-binding transcriptional regulator AlpA